MRKRIDNDPRNYGSYADKLAYEDMQARQFYVDDDEGQTEPVPNPVWIPPHGPTHPAEASLTVYALFDWWFASYEVKDPHHGWYSHLFDWRDDDWQPITRVFGESESHAFGNARKLARKLLLEGQRPQAESQSPELARCVAFWREHGTPMLARDA